MSAAYKSAMLQAFCIPVPQEDADSSSPKLNGHKPGGIDHLEPAEGWDGWTGEVIAIATSCDTPEAIDRLMTTRRQGLAALQRSRPDLYATIGEAVAGRLQALQRGSASYKRRASAKEASAPTPAGSGEGRVEREAQRAGDETEGSTAGVHSGRAGAGAPRAEQKAWKKSRNTKPSKEAADAPCDTAQAA